MRPSPSRPSSRGARPSVRTSATARSFIADGRMEGFVGGSCSRDIVRRQALRRDPHRAAAARTDRPGGAPDARRGNPRPDLRRADGLRVGRSRRRVHRAASAAAPLIVVGFTPVADDLARFGASLDVRRHARRRRRRTRRYSGRSTFVRSRRSSGCQSFSRRSRAGRARGASSRSLLRRDTTMRLRSKRCSPREAAAFVGLLASRKRAAQTCCGILAQQRRRGRR